MSPARARTRTARSGDERTNHEATGVGFHVGHLPPALYIALKSKKATLFLQIGYNVLGQRSAT